MERREQLRLLKGLIEHLDNKTNINVGGILKTPADTYISEERFEREWGTFFLNHPQIIGMSGDLDYITFGKNEPALLHYHNTYREALGLQSLPLEEA